MSDLYQDSRPLCTCATCCNLASVPRPSDIAASCIPGTQRQSSGAYSPPKCHMSLAHEKAAQQHSKQQFNITASAVAPRDPLNGLLQAVSFMGEFAGIVCLSLSNPQRKKLLHARYETR